MWRGVSHAVLLVEGGGFFLFLYIRAKGFPVAGHPNNF